MLKIKDVAQAYYEKTGAVKKDADIAKLLFPDSERPEQLWNRYKNGKSKTIRIEHVKMIADFYQCNINDLF